MSLLWIALFMVAVFGIVAWMLTGLARALKAERQAQPTRAALTPAQRARHDAGTIALALVIVGAAIVITGDARAGFRAGLIGAVIVAVIADARRRLSRR